MTAKEAYLYIAMPVVLTVIITVSFDQAGQSFVGVAGTLIALAIALRAEVFAPLYPGKRLVRPLARMRRVFSRLVYLSLIVFSVATVALLATALGVSYTLQVGTPHFSINAAASGFLLLYVMLVCSTLIFKVRSARMLDAQKGFAKDLGRRISNWHFAAGGPDPLSPSDGQVESYKDLLRSLCEISIKAAYSTGLKTFSRESDGQGLIAVLFLANNGRRKFVPVAISGGTPEYENAIKQFPPPFLNHRELLAAYNEVVRARANGNIQDDKSALERFRDRAKSHVSSTGIAFALNKKMVFNQSLLARCLAFRFDFLKKIPPEQRERFHFKQLVAVPVAIAQRSVGVLLFLSNRPRVFYSKDNIYYILSDWMAAAVDLGIRSRMLDSAGFADFYGSEQEVGSESNVEEVLQVINALSPKFDRLLPQI